MEVVVINGTKRAATGSAAATSDRNSGVTPCIMYGSGDPVAFTALPTEFKSLVYTPQFKLAEVKIDGKSYKCILKDIQFHPTTERVEHLDFLELVPGKKFKAEVPVRFSGSSIGVKNGGKFLARLRKVKIMTTPEKLIDEVVADITHLELGATLRVRDITLNEGVVILNAGPVPIAGIEIPRALRGAKTA